LIARFERHEAGPVPDGSVLDQPFHTLHQRIVLAPA